MRISRRRFGGLTGGLFASIALGEACRGESAAFLDDSRLTARPRPDATTSAAGTHALGLDQGRDGLLQMPSHPATGPLPLVVLLHGATGSAQGILRRVGPAADDAGVAVLAPDSRSGTWDAIQGRFGPDVVFMNRALQQVFETVAVDPARVAIGGFSDGATYALALGLMNGDLFHRVAAFSPGFLIDGQAQGRPEFFISHGRADNILPIDQTSRVIVPTLKRHGYTVTFREFDGVHEVPAAIAAEGMRWIAGATTPA